VNNQWIHVDPSLDVNDTRTLDPFIYERDWKTPPILALAFNNDSIVDVTNAYRQEFWVNFLSLEGLSYGIILGFTAVLMLTHIWAREFFYHLFFFQHNLLFKLFGKIYQKFLGSVYIVRFLLLLLLPLAIGIVIAPFSGFISINQDLIINALVVGLTLVTFSVVELPSLTKPHVFMSIIEDCANYPNCQLRKNGKDSKCKFQEDINCKVRENKAFLKIGQPKILNFRLQNLGFHSLKNCVICISFPREVVQIQAISKKIQLDFFKNYEIQKRNNAVKISPQDNFMSISPADCFVIPVKVALIRLPKKNETISVEISSETTWSTNFFELPIQAE
jgi:hypothetical protein